MTLPRMTPEQFAEWRLLLTPVVRTKIELSESGCPVWTGSCDTSGYAQHKRRGKLIQTHRYVYEQLVGPIEDDLTVDHLCTGHRNCLWPEHMELVSRSENSTRANHRRWVEGHSRKKDR